MSTKGETLYQPINGTPEPTWDGFSWPAFFFGVIWLLVKGLYGHFLVNLIIVFVTYGVALPFVWIAYGFMGNGLVKKKLLSKGYLTYEQWNRKQQAEGAAAQVQVAPAPPSPSATRDVAAQLASLADLRDKGVLTDEEFQVQKSKLLNA